MLPKFDELCNELAGTTQTTTPAPQATQTTQNPLANFLDFMEKNGYDINHPAVQQMLTDPTIKDKMQKAGPALQSLFTNKTSGTAPTTSNTLINKKM